MTAVSEERAARPVPRPLIRTFWAAHRFLFRITGGRFGLKRPATGKSFGMLHIETVGRRTGKRRETMIGYFEDGPNLVTMAMNGWARAEPAWWVNLQARPETTVTLPGGKRRVRARAATGAERDRLWADFENYPGWGNNLDGLAARRANETAVIVLEPRAENQQALS